MVYYNIYAYRSCGYAPIRKDVFTMNDLAPQRFQEASTAIPYDMSIEHNISPNGLRGGLHTHDAFELLYIVSDQVELQLDDRKYPVAPNTLILFNNTDLHCVHVPPEFRYERYVFYFVPEQLNLYSTAKTHLLECFYYRPFPTSQILPLTEEQGQVVRTLFDRLLAEMSSPVAQAGDDLLRYLIASEILVLANRSYHQYHGINDAYISREIQTIYDTLQYIAQHYQNKLELTDLAEFAHMSYHYMSRLFKQVTGISPHRYIVNLRIAVAKDMLIRGIPIQETCVQVGYSNLSHFSRLFKQYTGMSPSEYGAAHQLV